MLNLRKVVQEHPIIAIMRNVAKEDIIKYADTIYRGGISIFEVALNSKDALEEIKILRKRYDAKAYVGAGTVLSVADAKDAVKAGAQFLLSPSTDEKVLAYCAENDIAIMPGAMTPSEVALCLHYGFSIIKLFPAGFVMPGYAKSLKGPLEKADFIAIGGVSKDNAKQFLKEGYLGIGLGSNLISSTFRHNKEWENAVLEINNFVTDFKS